MSYPLILEAVKTRLAAVSGISYVVIGEPTTVQDTPMMFLQRDGGGRNVDAGGRAKAKHRIMAVLVVRWQDNATAEAQVSALIDPIYGAFDADPTLGGLNGWAQVTEDDAGYLQIGKTTYRTVEFTIVVEESACV